MRKFVALAAQMVLGDRASYAGDRLRPQERRLRVFSRLVARRPKEGLTTALVRLGLLGPGLRVHEATRSLSAFRSGPTVADGLPLPPARLRARVAGTSDAGWFVESGRKTAETIERALTRHGLRLEDAGRLLDFGCGCGRVVRHWLQRGPEIHGTDCEGHLARWCAENLPFGRFERNSATPPLAYTDDWFDVALAISVLTHLPEDFQHSWLVELRRVVRPGGLVILTIHGDRYMDRLSFEERRAYAAGRLVVRRPAAAGTNVCTTFHPPQYVREHLAAGFQLLEHTSGGAEAGTPYQDLVVLQCDPADPWAPNRMKPLVAGIGGVSHRRP